MKKEQWVVIANNRFENINATTLRGAKRLASIEFDSTGKVQVGIDHGENGGIEVMATKHPHEIKWIDSYR